jgi:uncharacterized protein (DUF1501 family)
MKRDEELARRRFLKTCLGTSAAGLGFFAAPRTLDLLNIALMSESQAATTPTDEDFKALVCVFLFGGMDSMHMIVPRSGNAYTDYQNSRRDLAIPSADLLPISPVNSQGQNWGLHPSMQDMQWLFNNKAASVVANCGGLIVPTSKTQYNNKSVQLPPQLFSHNDQQDYWVALGDGISVAKGWGGRFADMVYAQSPRAVLPMSFAINSNGPFLVGNNLQPLSVSPRGAIKFEGSWDANLQSTFESTIAMSQPTAMRREAGKRHSKAFENYKILDGILKAAPALNTVFPNTGLAKQMAMAAKLIQSRKALGMRRQIIFCGIGGFDTHDAQLNDLPRLLGEISGAFRAFFNASLELGVSDRVTTFTASDFGRTLTSNGDGSDHGWGNHHIVMGGAVNGGDIFGVMPDLRKDVSPDFVGYSNAMLPRISIEQYAGTLGKWYGLNDSQLNTIFPRLSGFSTRDVGFLAKKRDNSRVPSPDPIRT